MRHRHNGQRDGTAIGIFGQVQHKRLVDLERVDGEAFQVGKAGIAGAEIIDR